MNTRSIVVTSICAVVVCITTLTAACPIISVNARNGDTVASIARRYGTTTAAIEAANRGFGLYPLLTGQTINVPACRVVPRLRWPVRSPRR